MFLLESTQRSCTVSGTTSVRLFVVNEGTMTLAELEGSLPNGFHDAGLVSIMVDIASETLTLGLLIDMSTADDRTTVYRNASVQLSGLRGLILDNCPFEGFLRKRLTVSGLVPTERELPGIEKIAPESRRVLYSFFVLQWNAFFHIAADNASISWTESGIQ